MPIIISTPYRAPEFSPITISDLYLWWDFSDVSTLFQDTARTNPITADGQNILGVNDKSGNGHHVDGGGGISFGGSDYKENIHNGHSVMRGPRLGKNLSPDVLQPFTIAIACDSPDPGGSSTKPCVFGLFSSGAAGRVQFAHWFSGNNMQFRSDTPLFMQGGGLLGPAVSNSTWGVFFFHVDSAGSPRDTQVYHNGTLINQGSSGNNRIDQFQLNSSFDPNDNNSGDIGEVMIYDKLLTTTERANVTNYLMTKWGL